MTVDEMIKYFGSGRKACIALGISERNLTIWRRKGTISMIQQFKLERLTQGVLKADINNMDEKNDFNK